MVEALKRLTILAVLAVLAGTLAAAFTPEAQAVWASYTVRNMPGPPPDTGVLNCGWHSGACPGSGMVALDWQAGGGSTIYWRSWVYHQYAAPNSVVAQAQSRQFDSAVCYRTRVRLFHNPSGAYMGAVYYTHTQSNGQDKNIWGSSSWQYTKVSIATTRSTEKPLCPWEGPHVHQADDSAEWSENTAYPTSSQCTLCYWSYNVTTWSNYQFVRSGQAQY